MKPYINQAIVNYKLRQENERLRAENAKLRGDVKAVVGKATGITKEEYLEITGFVYPNIE